MDLPLDLLPFQFLNAYLGPGSTPESPLGSVLRLKAAGLTPPARELGRGSGWGCGVGLQILWSGHQGTVQLSLRVPWGHLNPLLSLGPDPPYTWEPEVPAALALAPSLAAAFLGLSFPLSP